MSSETIKVSLPGLEEFAAKLFEFGVEVNSYKADQSNTPPLLPGSDSFAPAVSLKKAYEEYRTSVIGAVGKLHGDIDLLRMDLWRASRKLGDGEHDSLTEAQMLDILKDLMGGTGSPTTI
ncbi:hypothetical protein OG535_06200 [Kitasatospora sp. NBC_00085]|uniref:hypothetical protein n=1 Tax=unclassified Kitasatospora TaxID=2633591 RepID=UPI0032529330